MRFLCGFSPSQSRAFNKFPSPGKFSQSHQHREAFFHSCGSNKRSGGDHLSSSSTSSVLVSALSSVDEKERKCRQCATTTATTTATISPERRSASTWSSTLASVFTSSPHDSAIFSLAFPAILALAADPLLQIIDTIFIGQQGSDALAALGVNSALFTFSFIVFNFLATATTPLVATALAQGDQQRAGTVTLQALLLATLLGTCLSVGLTLGADQALMIMGADASTNPEMFSLAKDFLLIRALAAPAVMLMTVGTGAFRGLQDMRTPLYITLGTNCINLVLDATLILGLGWGVKGAATSTTVAEWVAAVAYVSLLWRSRDKSFGGFDVGSAMVDVTSFLGDMKPFLTAGGAVLMRTALLLGTKTLASATAARLGPIPIASHQVVMQLWLLSSLLIDSLAVAGQSLVAVEKGRGDVFTARQVSNRLLQLGVGGGIFLSVAFWAVHPYIPGIFTNDAQVISATEEILPLAVAMLPINAAVYVFDGILVGSSDFKWMAGAMLISAAAAVALLFGVEPMNSGLPGVWEALAVLMTGRLVTLVWRYQSKNGPLPPSPPPLASVSSLSSLGGEKEENTDDGSGDSVVDSGTTAPECQQNIQFVKPPMHQRQNNNKQQKRHPVNRRKNSGATTKTTSAATTTKEN